MAHDQLVVGHMLPPRTLPPVSAEKMKTMAALLSDSNPIHFDVDAVRALGMGDRPVNQGPTNMAYIMNYLVDWAGSNERISRLSVRFRANVFAGQVAEVRGQITAITAHSVDIDVELVADGVIALSGTGTVLRDGGGRQ